jgi:sec-independent protein translocase protein TatA
VDIGAPELLIILAVVLLIFGGSKLPQLARSLGQAKTEFEKGAKGHASAEAPPEDGKSD